jgi:hypothetical protein
LLTQKIKKDHKEKVSMTRDFEENKSLMRNEQQHAKSKTCPNKKIDIHYKKKKHVISTKEI